MSSAQQSMPYVRLGKSGLKVSKIILGCMSYGSSKWQPWVLDEEEGIKHIETAYKAGINTFDTANVYSNGESEVVLGKAIKKLNVPRSSLVIMTKVFMTVADNVDAPYLTNPDEEGYVNRHGLSRKHIFESIKDSLKRLDLEYVDVLQCHRFDYDTPIEETMQALHDVVQAGYARYIGMSSCYAYQLHAMQNYAIVNKLTPFISMQNFHNAIYREEEREMMPTLKLFGMGCIPWSPLARGFLARPVDEKTKRSASDRQWVARGLDKPGPATVEINERVQKLAKEKGVSMAQVSLAWSLANDYISAPIVGTTSLENLQDLIAGVHLKLSEEEKKFLDEPYAPREISGHA